MPGPPFYAPYAGAVPRRGSEKDVADALLNDMPPRLVEQDAIVAANRSGRVGAPA